MWIVQILKTALARISAGGESKISLLIPQGGALVYLARQPSDSK